MRIRLSERSLLPELLLVLRQAGCIAYYDAEADEIEAIRPHAFGEQETRELKRLLAGWQNDHPGVAVTLEPE